MTTVTIPKTEYEKLSRQAKAYRESATRFFRAVLSEEALEDVMEDFRKTGLYTEEFLIDLEAGLRKSSQGRSDE